MVHHRPTLNSTNNLLAMVNQLHIHHNNKLYTFKVLQWLQPSNNKKAAKTKINAAFASQSNVVSPSLVSCRSLR